MNFSNFNSVHGPLIPSQTDWPYGPTYGGQESQQFVTGSPPGPSYSTGFHNQNPYASYNNMFNTGGNSESGSGGPTVFYTTSTTPNSQMAPQDSSPYKLDFNTIVDEKILNENNSDNSSPIPVSSKSN